MHPTNREIADALDQTAQVLELHEDNPFRVRAFRRAARTVEDHAGSVAELLTTGGREALQQLSGIGPGLAAAIEEFVLAGRISQRDRLLQTLAPETFLRDVPGIGPTLARRLHEELGIQSFEDLEAAAYDGRLERMGGFGPRRIRALKETLNAMLSPGARWRERRLEENYAGAVPHRPAVELLLEVDARYRDLAEAGKLPTIAPRRFNPEGKAWLPVLNVRKDGWSITALYSNTAQAHRLGKTHDWVVLFYERGDRRGQCTVVTETRGPRTGGRVVRGREDECARASG